MGNSACKKSSGGTHHNTLTTEENDKIIQLYKSINEAKVVHLTQMWSGQLEQNLQKALAGYVVSPKNPTTVDFDRFCNLFAYLVRGSVYEKADVLVELLTDRQKTETVAWSTIINYTEGLISTFVLSNKNIGWANGSQSDTQLLAESLCSDLSLDAPVTYNDITSLLSNSPIISALQASVLGKLYKINTTIQRLVPTSGDSKKFGSILNLCSVMFINASLPAALRDEWRPLFSSQNHGESFSKLLGMVQKKGPTVLIIKDKGGAVFGGFAPDPWTLSPNFVGNETSFLFRLKPTMSVYPSTHFNNHYQYLNVQQQTMPNGLGMGGQFGYWGLWIDAEFGAGHSSETCTTYRDCKTLSSTKEFQIDHLEVWAIGPLPVVEEEVGTRSILDTNTEAKAMLEMIGKSAHSDGLREPEEIDY